MRLLKILLAVVSLLVAVVWLFGDISWTTEDSAQVMFQPGDAKERAEAIRVAETLLGLIDEGDLTESWELTSPVLRDMTSQLAWKTGIWGMRKGVGKPIRRELIDAAYTEKMPDAPPGSYFQIAFQTEFERATVVERVIIRSERGAWKVAGYFLDLTFGRAAEGERL